MGDGTQTTTPIARLIGGVCWAVIAVFLGLKAFHLAQGSPLLHELDFSDLSALGILAAVAAMVLIFRSPKVLRSTTMIEPTEIRTVVLSFLLVFVLMASYYALRPVRDAMASDWSNTEISVLWNIQLVLSTFVVALYGWACSRVRFTLLVPIVYVFFAVTFVAFYFGSSFVSDRVLLDKAFYIWVTLFSLCTFRCSGASWRTSTAKSSRAACSRSSPLARAPAHRSVRCSQARSCGSSAPITCSCSRRAFC